LGGDSERTKNGPTNHLISNPCRRSRGGKIGKKNGMKTLYQKKNHGVVGFQWVGGGKRRDVGGVAGGEKRLPTGRAEIGYGELTT